MSELITIPMMEIEEQKKIIKAQEKLIESLEKNIDVFKENDDIRKVIIDCQELRIKKLKQENKALKNKLAECHEALSETEGAIEETKDLAQKAGCYNLLLKKTYDEDLVKKDLIIIELQEKLIESKNKLAELNGQTNHYCNCGGVDPAPEIMRYRAVLENTAKLENPCENCGDAGKPDCEYQYCYEMNKIIKSSKKALEASDEPK